MNDIDEMVKYKSEKAVEKMKGALGNKFKDLVKKEIGARKSSEKKK